MELFHTSPSTIEKINATGLYGEFLFFSGRVYTMTAVAAPITYAINIDDSKIIDASNIFCDEKAEILSSLVKKLAERYGVDEDTAESLIDESANIYDIDCNVDAEDLADASWDIQKFTANAAKMLGYRGVKVTDEQGDAYMIDMLGHENELQAA
jgi:hypothetical protein